MNRHALLATAAALLALAAPARAQQAEPRILVTGVVVDSASGNPVYGVAIATSTPPDHTASDSTGAFTLSVPAGTVMLTFTGRGFERTGQVVSATRNVDLGHVALLPEAYALAPIEASVSMLEQRARNTQLGVRVFSDSWLQHSGAEHLLRFVEQRTGIRHTGCNTLDPASGGDCWRIRGAAARPDVYVNEVRAPPDALTLYRPEDVARVEVYGGGQMIRVYTRLYLEMMERGQVRPDPIFPAK